MNKSTIMGRGKLDTTMEFFKNTVKHPFQSSLAFRGSDVWVAWCECRTRDYPRGLSTVKFRAEDQRADHESDEKMKSRKTHETL